MKKKSVIEKIRMNKFVQYDSINSVLDKFDINESPHMVVFDCTASPAISKLYTHFLKKGFHLVTANKIANSSDLKFYKKIRIMMQKQKKKFYYEANVGAALPIIETIKSMINSGDEIRKIEGVFSGSLSFIFNQYKGKKSFSQIVKEAKENGYTEPDPRNDLNGRDVLRKLLILARETGVNIDESDVRFKSMLSDADMEITLEAFYQKLESNEEYYKKLYQNAFNAHKKLIYYARFDIENGAKIGIEEVDSEHPAYNIQSGDNIFIIYSKRYHRLPLVIKGPGAGAEITASGLYSDFLKLCSTL